MGQSDIACNVTQRTVNPHFLGSTASCDVASNIQQAPASGNVSAALLYDGVRVLNFTASAALAAGASVTYSAHGRQGLTLLHFSAQRKRFLWDRGCISGLFMGCLGGVLQY